MKQDKTFVEIIKSVQRMGTTKALDVLKNVRIENERFSCANIINLIINTVIKEWGYKYKKEDFFRRQIRGEVVQARKTIIVVASKLTLIRKVAPSSSSSPSLEVLPVKITESEALQEILYEFVNLPGDGARTIRRTLREYRKLDINNKIDKVIINRTEKVLEAVSIKIKNKK